MSNTFELKGTKDISNSNELKVTKLAYRCLGKRVFDLFLSAAILPTVAPIICVLWVFVSLGGGNGFFGHKRIGKNGREFKCWKIQTMVIDAEKRLQDHLASDPEAAAEWARDHKLTNDPRITRFGRFLRKSSLDELPQIWNVIKGEMSFVGPRPIVRDELPKYGAHQKTYFSMKPGITGLWQVSGRNGISYDERVQLDVSYQEKMNFLFDIKLIAKTALAMINRTGL